MFTKSVRMRNGQVGFAGCIDADARIRLLDPPQHGPCSRPLAESSRNRRSTLVVNRATLFE